MNLVGQGAKCVKKCLHIIDLILNAQIAPEFSHKRISYLPHCILPLLNKMPVRINFYDATLYRKEQTTILTYTVKKNNTSTQAKSKLLLDNCQPNSIVYLYSVWISS